MRPAHHPLVPTCLIALVLALLGTACQSNGGILPKEDTEEWPECKHMMEELDELVEQGSVEALDLFAPIRTTCWDIVRDRELTAIEIDVAARHGLHERVIQTVERYTFVVWSFPDEWRLPLALARAGHAASLAPQEAAEEFGRALSLTDAVLADDPDDVGAHIVRGVALEGLGRRDEALVAYGEVVVRAGDDEELRRFALEAQAKLEAVSDVDRAAAQLAQGDVDAALATLEAVLEREPDLPRARGLRALAGASRLDETSTVAETEALLADCRASLAGGFVTPRITFLDGFLPDRLGRSGEALGGYRRYLLGGGLASEPPQNVVFAAERRAILAGLESGMGELASASSANQLRPLRDRAAGGDVDALLELGELVRYGRPGLVPDVELAAVWYTRAAEHPDTPSAEAAWRLFELDASLEQLDVWAAMAAEDPAAVEAEREVKRARAEVWLVRAAELGSPNAGYELALRAEFEDPVEASAWALAVSERAEGTLREKALALFARVDASLSDTQRVEAALRATQR